jgi:hypothetical protein
LVIEHHFSIIEVLAPTAIMLIENTYRCASSASTA